MQRSRSFRRHHRARIRRRRSSYFTVAWAAGDVRATGVAVKTPKRCRCVFCSNLRWDYGEMIRQERVAEEAERREIADWLAVAEPAFSFWDNEVDDAYNSI